MENRIKELRTNLGLSQETLARRCDVSRQTVNAIENSKYDPTLSLAFRLARELETTVDGLFRHNASASCRDAMRRTGANTKPGTAIFQ